MWFPNIKDLETKKCSSQLSREKMMFVSRSSSILFRLNYNNFIGMHLKIQEHIHLSKLELLAEFPSPIKRKAKIFSKRLPEDFFPFGKPRSPARRNDVHTQDFCRKIPSIERKSETRQMNMRVGYLSARLKEEQDSTMCLIRSVVETSKKMRKIIRKHSFQTKNESNYSGIYNENYKLQLPPLLVKKGIPSGF